MSEEVRHRIIYEDGVWEEWVGPRDDRTIWYVPEYHPPPRVEAWLTLPAGVKVERDDWDYEPWELPEPRRSGKRRLPHESRFVAEFGLNAAVDWGLVPTPFSWILRDVFTSERLSAQLSANRQFLWQATVPQPIIGKTATIPITDEPDAGR